MNKSEIMREVNAIVCSLLTCEDEEFVNDCINHVSYAYLFDDDEIESVEVEE